MKLLPYIHAYIINHYNPSVCITAQLLTPLMLCALILYVSGQTYSLTSTPNDRFLRNFFMAGLFHLRVFARNLLKASCRRNIFHISFLMTELGFEVAVVYQVVCWLIIRKARVRAPGQTAKQNTKCISSAISSQQIADKISESKLKLP